MVLFTKPVHPIIASHTKVGNMQPHGTSHPSSSPRPAARRPNPPRLVGAGARWPQGRRRQHRAGPVMVAWKTEL